MNDQLSIGDIIKSLREIPAAHDPTNRIYSMLQKAAKERIACSNFTKQQPIPEAFEPFSEIIFPYLEMGAINSLDLFGLDELIIFAFYWANRHRYKKAADIGANIGLHSLIMSRCGISVQAYEPDPYHAQVLRRNMELNSVQNVQCIEAAVSDEAGEVEFVRVLGNTTSSHLVGAKNNAYGELERFPVKVVSIKEIMPEVDFLKIDAEGQERVILLATTTDDWVGTEAIVEMGSRENAEAIFIHLQEIGVSAFSQKKGWAQVRSVADVPINYREGSLFITSEKRMEW
jgi:FkbM family methyltransferase